MRTLTWVCCGMLALATAARAQRIPTGAAPTSVGVTIAIKAGSANYQFAGQAKCTHAPMAAIYGIVSEQWNVEHSDGSRSLHLTLWRPKNGSGDMLTLSVATGGRPQTVTTVHGNSAPPPE